MLQEDMSSKMAQIARQIKDRGGSVDVAEMDRILNGFRITKMKRHYKKTLVEVGYLYFDELANRYWVTKEGEMSATITVTVTSLYATAVQRYITQALSAHAGIVEVGEVEI